MEFLLLLSDPGSWGGFQRILPTMAEHVHDCVRSEMILETLYLPGVEFNQLKQQQVPREFLGT